MKFDEFYNRYLTTLFELSKASPSIAIFIREDLQELCNRYPEYEEEAERKLFTKISEQ